MSRRELADLLDDLKNRSGHSFETLARKTYLSRSSVHRYCTGVTVPREFGVVERLALACGADRAELARLHRVWTKATEPATEPPDGVAPDPPVTVRKNSWSRRARVAIACLVLLGVVAVPTSSRPVTPTGHVVVPEPVWTQMPTPVPRSFLGVTVGSSSGAMPTFSVGAVRFWDSHTRWANLEPRRGQYDWSVLDRLVSGAARAGVPAMFTLGGTPGWASPSGPRTAYDDGSRTSAPDDLADWTSFVRAVVQRYRGRIGAYELWALANDPRFYSGSLETLVEMTRLAQAVIKSVDPAATVVCPSMGRLWDPRARQALRRFAQLRGYDHCDVAGVKLYPRTAADPPESMLELAGLVDRAFHQAGVHPQLWNTGTTFDIPLRGHADPDTAVDQAVRFYLVGLWAHYRRMYLYSWGTTKVPIVLQADGAAPTPAALAVEELGRWLDRAAVHSCGYGTDAGLPPTVFQCRFTNDTNTFLIRWTSAGIATTTAPPDSETLRELDGTAHLVRPGDTVTVGTRPVLLALRS